MQKPRPLVMYGREWARVSGFHEPDYGFHATVTLSEMPMFLSDKQVARLGAWLVKADRWIKTKKGNIR